MSRKKAAMRIGMLSVILTLAASCVIRSQQAYKPADNSRYDLPYASGVPGAEFLKLDAHWPNGAKDLPVLVYIHGGGWSASDKSEMNSWAQRMSDRGYVVFNVNYRLAPKYQFPIQVNDCLGAIAWIQEHAEEYGGNASRIGITGGSAGGHLIAMVSTAWNDPHFSPTGYEGKNFSLKVSAQVPFFGVFDFNQPGLMAATNIPSKFLGGSKKKAPDNYQLASPINYVSKDSPPTLLVVGKLDPIYSQTRLYYQALKDTGVPVELKTYPLQTHGFDINFKGKASNDAFNRMMTFFDQHLK